MGGIWNCTPLTLKPNGSVNGDLNSSSAPTSNLSHMLMQYSDTPFLTGTQLLSQARDVLQYLRDYASEIVTLIRFNNWIFDVRLDEWS